MPDRNAFVAVFTPEGRDGELAAAVLREAGMVPHACADLEETIASLGTADCAILAEEALLQSNRKPLARWIAAQPPWSDFPFLLLTRRGGAADQRLTDLLGNVTILERPFHPSVLVSAVRSATRARRRQRQAEIYLSERELLIRELHHRVKNTLATVLALLRTGSRPQGSIEDFKQVFRNRVLSLSRTHALLVEAGWRTASLRDVLWNELEPYDDGNRRVVLHGPAVDLPRSLALPVGMAVHELTTNAAKYGSLSAPQGKVKVLWTVQRVGAVRQLYLAWCERNGPAVEKPNRTGFGSTLIERVLVRQCGANLRTDFRKTGLRFRMILPLPDGVGETQAGSPTDGIIPELGSGPPEQRLRASPSLAQAPCPDRAAPGWRITGRRRLGHSAFVPRPAPAPDSAVL